MENLEQLEAVEMVENGAAAEMPCPPDAVQSSILGKFANSEELGKAYENLQAEFTRKSQRLAELESANVQDKASVANNYKVLERETALESCAVLDRDEIIKEYLTSVAAKQQAPVVITTNNDFAFSSNAGPKSIREISRVAENFFKNKNA